MSREAAISRFLQGAGWGGAERMALAGDASSRRYERLHQGPRGATAILMDAPPDRGVATAPFVSIARSLAAFGLSAPAILAWDETEGLILLEDFGDDLVARISATDPEREPTLYAAAVDTLVALHAHPVPAGVPPYAHDDMAGRAALAALWYLPGATGRSDIAGAQRLTDEVRRSLAALAPGHDVLALRDYHAENLVWLPDRDGVRRIGLLDFQDAMAGHPAYDLVSLLEDARRDVNPTLRAAMLQRYIDATGKDPDTFAAACATLATQRNLRILGVFARLCLHYGKPQYVDLLPRVWSHLQRDLGHPGLGTLRTLVAELLPEPAPECLERIKEGRGTWPTP